MRLESLRDLGWPREGESGPGGPVHVGAQGQFDLKPSGARSRPKVILLTNIPAPYRIEQFNLLALSQRFAFKIYFYSESEPNRSWSHQDAKRRIRFEHEYLRARPIVTQSRFSYVTPRFLLRLVAERPWAVIVCGFSSQLALAILHATWRRTKVLVWSDSNILSEMNLPKWRTLARRALVRGVSGAIAASHYGVEYFKFLGVPEDRIVISRYVSDPAWLGQAVAAARIERDALKRKLGLQEGAVVLLAPSRLEKEKGCREMVTALADAAGDLDGRVHLVFVGSGSLQTHLERLARDLGVGERVTFAGFKEYVEMPSYYAIADLVVLPSLEEPYGLVVNESIAARVPVLCSRFAGASDLLRDGRYGSIFDPSDRAEFKRTLVETVMALAEDGGRQRDQASREISHEEANAAIERALSWGTA